MAKFNTFKFKVGKHYSKPSVFEFIGGDSHYVSWKFIDRPQQVKRHTNKLIGVGYFPHHMWKSWRLGYEKYKGKMIYSIFIHVNGKFQIHPIPDLTGYQGAIKIDVKNDLITVTDERYNSEKAGGVLLEVPFKTPKPNFGYMLKPYHGGKEAAMNDYSVNVFIAKYHVKKNK